MHVSASVLRSNPRTSTHPCAIRQQARTQAPCPPGGHPWDAGRAAHGDRNRRQAERGRAISQLAADPRTAPVAELAKQALSQATRLTAFCAAIFLGLGLLASLSLGRALLPGRVPRTGPGGILAELVVTRQECRLSALPRH